MRTNSSVIASPNLVWRNSIMSNTSRNDDDESWSEWTYYNAKDAVNYGRKARTYANRTKSTYRGVKKVAPVVRKVAPAARVAGRSALKLGGRAVMKVAPSVGRAATAAIPELSAAAGPLATAAGPVGIAVAAGLVLAGAVEHFGGRTYIENEMRWIEHKVFGRKQGKARPPII